MTNDLLGDFIFVAALMTLGFWLESINGKRGFPDELLAPLPLGLGGIIMLIGEAALA